MALVYRMSEAQLNAWLNSAVPRDESRSGGLITSPEREPIRPEWSPESRRHTMAHFRRRCAESRARRRTFRDN